MLEVSILQWLNNEFYLILFHYLGFIAKKLDKWEQQIFSKMTIDRARHGQSNISLSNTFILNFLLKMFGLRFFFIFFLYSRMKHAQTWNMVLSASWIRSQLKTNSIYIFQKQTNDEIQARDTSNSIYMSDATFSSSLFSNKLTQIRSLTKELIKCFTISVKPNEPDHDTLKAKIRLNWLIVSFIRLLQNWNR